MDSHIATLLGGGLFQIPKAELLRLECNYARMKIQPVQSVNWGSPAAIG